MRSAKLVRFADFLSGKQWKMDYFDTSEYSRDHFLYRARNKKVLWKMKDATHRVPVEKFVGLRPKMYSILFTKDNKPVEKKAAKAFPRTWQSENFDISIISHVSEKQVQMARINQIWSETHQLYSLTLTNTCLSPHDDKRYILEDGCHTLAYGHDFIYEC